MLLALMKKSNFLQYNFFSDQWNSVLSENGSWFHVPDSVKSSVHLPRLCLSTNSFFLPSFWFWCGQCLILLNAPSPRPPRLRLHNVSLEILYASLTFLAQLYQLIEATSRLCNNSKSNQHRWGKSLVTHRTNVDRRALDLIVYANSMIIHLNRIS